MKDFVVRNSKWVVFLGIPLLTLLMHLHIIPQKISGIHAWRQCETASNIVNFYERDFHPLNPRVHNLEWEDGLKRMEFPIMQWGMTWSYQLFGEEIWMIRLMTFLIGLFSIWGMYYLVRLLFRDEWLAVLGAWCFSFSPVFFYYTVNPLPDNLALMAGIWGLVGFMRWYRHGGYLNLCLSAAFLLLATLAKLPFILFYGLPFGYALVDTLRSRFRRTGRNTLIALPGILSLALPAVWYLKVIPTWQGNGVIAGIFDANPDEYWIITKIFVKNMVSTLPELLINYGAFPFLMAGIWFLWKNKARHKLLWPAFAIMGAGVGAYYMFEINMISTVHDYYLFPFLPGLFLIVVYGLREAWNWQANWAKGFVWFAMAVLPLTAALRTYPRWDLKGIPEDLLEMRAELRQAVPDDAICLVGHDLSPHIFLYHLHKRGWNIDKENINSEWLQDRIERGATFLYSDTPEIQNHSSMKPFLRGQVAEIGEFTVWKLGNESSR